MTQYESASIERRWQKMWKEGSIYHFNKDSDDPIFSIDNPPRYTSGSLHLGHATGYSMIDFVARYRRMRGYNVFFPLCFDVNGTPVEVKVEKKHNITKLDLPRKEYRRLCTEFANSFIDEMKHHFEILGESMDPSIYYQTDAPYYRRITQVSFVKLFNKGLVYKGNFPVNWCPRCMTALADAEVEYENNVVTKMNYIKFMIDGTNDHILVATTRPELLCTCKVVAVHPDDKEKQYLVGKELITPLYGRKVKVIADHKVDPEFGTGNVMICTIGDKDDLEWVMRYKLGMEKGIDELGCMTELAGKYKGMKVKDARAAAIDDLKEKGLLVKQENSTQNVSICWRCHTPVEFLQVPQWFLKTLDFKEQVLKRADEMNWFPEFMKIRLQDWVNSLEWDWVLSRQRIFATPVPVWECNRCGKAVVAKEDQCYVDPTEDSPPIDKCGCGGELIGCTDVFDTWMDSSGSPLYNTFWERDEKMFKKMFPMSMRPQSHDIIRTWAFYTMLRSEQIASSIPWKDVMIHGFIMSPDGTPMHSSIGNVINPIPIIEEYGADALRYYASTCSMGIDHAFREKDVIRGRRLCNKIFNMGKFVGPRFDSEPKRPSKLRTSDKWILSRYSDVVKKVTGYFEGYQFDKAMRDAEDFIWHEFADHYIEMVKARKDDAVRYTLYTVLLGCIKMIAPFMPHITEDVYQEHFIKYENIKSIHLTKWPEPVLTDKDAERTGDILKDVIAAVRGWKSDKKMPLNAELSMVELIGDALMLNDARDDIVETIKAKDLEIAEKADITEEVVSIKPVHAKLGPAFKGAAKSIVSEIAKMDPKKVAAALDSGGLKMTVEGNDITLTKEFLESEKRLMLNGKQVETIQVGGILIAIEP
ncbi:MAG: valine--tRNA ligase [Methanomassiliicoccaceae archaeon]|jgi:valyl-tRNA synthetase|nr:valine--tRNA ligase [Methanomassiliicoccaceae archaeon]